MTRKLFILTGASRGLGAAIAEQLLERDHQLLCISRHRSETLAQRADAAGAGLEQWELDLSQPVQASARLSTWFATLSADSFDRATLINNAAALTQIGPIEDCSDTELSSALRVGLETPMLLCAAFLRATRNWKADKRVVNISSGLARRAMAGQATYCASKAGMDHLTRALALDQAHLTNGAKLVSLAPGAIDTDMQIHLRAGDPSGFPERANFVEMKEKGQLTSASEAAARVLAYLARADFGSNPTADVREV